MKEQASHLILDTLEQLADLKERIPQAVEGFTALSKAALQDGKLEGRTKELIALAIAITQNSAHCIKFHLESLIKKNLTQAELYELISVCTYMGGGPALTAALNNIDLFKAIPAVATTASNS